MYKAPYKAQKAYIAGFGPFLHVFGGFAGQPLLLVVVKRYFRSKNGKIVLYVFLQLAARSDFASTPY